MGWIAVDLDGTLAQYDGWRGWEQIGEPIPLMLIRVKEWLKKGREVRIFTARVSHGPKAIERVQEWCVNVGLGKLKVTNVKDFTCSEIWDDRAVSVEKNTGAFLDANNRSS